VQTLNDLFTLAVPTFRSHGGHVDKFVGDGLMVRNTHALERRHELTLKGRTAPVVYAPAGARVNAGPRAAV
jgi:hypothetical protein